MDTTEAGLQRYHSTWTISQCYRHCLTVLSLHWALGFSELERMPDCTEEWVNKNQKPDFLLLCLDDETGHSLSSDLCVHVHACTHTHKHGRFKWMYKVENDHLTCLVETYWWGQFVRWCVPKEGAGMIKAAKRHAIQNSVWNGNAQNELKRKC